MLILDIGHRKEVYRMVKTKTESASDKGMKQSDFDEIMAKALGTPPPENDDAKRLSSTRERSRLLQYAARFLRFSRRVSLSA